MAKKIDKPVVRKYYKHEWEFVHPDAINSDKARDKLWEGVQLLHIDPKMAEQIFKGLISKYPYFIDAYNHLSLAFRYQNQPSESLLTAGKSYILGKECFPKEFDFEKDKLPWGILENRPFLRACQTYGLECQNHKDYATAIKVFSENLTLNPDDNQGIRYLLLEVFFAMKDYQQARQFIDKHPDDYSIDFRFGAVVLDILEGNVEQADKDLKEAVEVNKFFVDEVVKQKHIPPPPVTLPGMPNFPVIPMNSIQQAYEYWERNKELFKTKEIIEYFKDRQKSLA
jgi:tetratricopeptide (TPR) repeat protein